MNFVTFSLVDETNKTKKNKNTKSLITVLRDALCMRYEYIGRLRVRMQTRKSRHFAKHTSRRALCQARLSHCYLFALSLPSVAPRRIFSLDLLPPQRTLWRVQMAPLAAGTPADFLSNLLTCTYKRPRKMHQNLFFYKIRRKNPHLTKCRPFS